MPIPILIGLWTAISSVSTLQKVVGGVALIAPYKDEILDAVYKTLNSESSGAWFASIINARLAAAGLDLEFRDVFDGDKTKDDLDKFGARRINAKAGTNFVSIKGLTRDDFLVEVSKLLAAKLNAETGAHITAMWPIEKLRQELGTELARQFDPDVDLSAGSLFPRAAVEAIELAVGKKLGILHASPVGEFWPPPATEKDEIRRAKGRDRQAKYRRTHRLQWVEK